MIWKVLTVAFAIGCFALTLVIVRDFSRPRLNDPRLYGTWVSDRERTLEFLPLDESRDSLRDTFGKLKVTYTDSVITTELDGFVETMPYTVLGIDKYSVVFRDDSERDPEMDFLELSRFVKIYFDSADTYWLTTEVGGYREWFKRVLDEEPPQ